jgi:hypothetical protein
MKKIIIEFTDLEGNVEEIEFVTDRSVDWTVQQWSRNRRVASYKVISENSVNNKGMLLD